MLADQVPFNLSLGRILYASVSSCAYRGWYSKVFIFALERSPLSSNVVCIVYASFSHMYRGVVSERFSATQTLSLPYCT